VARLCCSIQSAETGDAAAESPCGPHSHRLAPCGKASGTVKSTSAQPHRMNVRAVQVTPQQGSPYQPLLLFSTNDYLGLSGHPGVRQAAAGAGLAFGMGVRSAAIVAGHSSVHERLERSLAALKHAEACLLFPTGYAANLAAITALSVDGRVAIFSDELNHASLIDGCRLAKTRGATLHVYRHQDYAHLGQLLAQHSTNERKLVVTDGVFSMDGDIVDVQVLAVGAAFCFEWFLCVSVCGVCI
jgi:7-keto-8-aminopelargonate synthetase-like enzyme